MNMNQPPIDELEEIMGNRYRLCTIVEKRAKELEKRIPAELENSDDKSISRAAKEVYEGDIVSSDMQANKINTKK